MDGRGECCIARYTGGHAAAYNTSKMDRIMLKFRPIAPKPTATATSDGGDTAPKAATGGGRGRRKFGKDKDNSTCNTGTSKRCNNNNGKKRKSFSPPDPTAEIVPDQRAVMTLPLLPEAPDLSPRKGPTDDDQKMPMWQEVNNSPTMMETLDPTVGMAPGGGQQQQERVVGSCVTVERITDTWMDQIGAGVNVRMRLEHDTCPGFVSDGWNRVWWTNDAYRRMVMGDTWRDQKMVVWVVMREEIPETLQGFTCRVRVQQSYDGKEVRGSALTVPCDVWRIEGGGFAWRLDVEAALSLGR